jgi:hypothetical protein
VKQLHAEQKLIIFHFSYKHAIDGLWRVYTEEGFRRLFSGASTATSRAVFMTIGQLSFYDQVKKMLLESGYFQDNLFLHFTASSIAGGIATCMTQPLDVLKTRAMNAKPGEFNSVFDIVRSVAKLGPLGLFYSFGGNNRFLIPFISFCRILQRLRPRICSFRTAHRSHFHFP